MLSKSGPPPPLSPRSRAFLGSWDTIASLSPSLLRWPDTCMNWYLARMQVRSGLPSPGMTGVSRPWMTCSACAPQHPFMPMPILQSLLNCTLMPVDLVWGLSSARLMMMGMMPSLPMPARVWQRLRPIIPPINWSFSPLSGLWLRNFISIFVEQPLMPIPTITPWCPF